MSKLLVGLLATLAMTTGCYFGPGPTAKKIAYAANGALLAAGTADAVLPHRDSDEGNVAKTMDAILITAGVIGIVFNLAMPTDKPSDALAGLHKADGTVPTFATSGSP